jgi:hypothetical protein
MISPMIKSNNATSIAEPGTTSREINFDDCRVLDHALPACETEAWKRFQRMNRIKQKWDDNRRGIYFPGFGKQCKDEHKAKWLKQCPQNAKIGLFIFYLDIPGEK